jgi:transposase-like protein
MTLALVGNTLLRTAITRNLVTFPAQVQPFMKRTSGDLQERIVQLYFVRGWSVRNICDRYGMSKAMVHKLLAEWRIRAVESGYIQEIEPDCLSALEPEIAAGGVAAAAVAEADEHSYEPPVLVPVPQPVEVIYVGQNPASLSVPEAQAAMLAATTA